MMTLSLILDCPHCLKPQMGFTVLAFTQRDRNQSGLHGGNAKTGKSIPTTENSYFARCANCDDTVIAKIAQADTGPLAQTLEDALAGDRNFVLTTEDSPQRIVQIIPPAPHADIPDGLPDPVAAPFSEAEASYVNGQFNGAAALYRKATERAVVAIAPDAAQIRMLGPKIAQLEKTDLLPGAMLDWIRTVKDDANFALHDNDRDMTSRADIDPARIFTRTLLIYLFTMPKMLADAKARHSAR